MFDGPEDIRLNMDGVATRFAAGATTYLSDKLCR